jgi:integrase/recombinase XerC
VKVWVQRFLNALRARRNFSAHTHRAYAADLAEFEAFWTANKHGEPGTLCRQHVRAYLAHVQDPAKKLSRNSVLRKISCLRSFARYLLEEKVLRGDPFLNVPLPKKEHRLPRFLTESEMGTLSEKGCEGQDWQALRDKAMVELLYSSGLRRSELVRMSVGDVDFMSGSVRVFGKGSRERVVPAGKAALQAIRDYLRSRPASVEGGARGPLWVNAQLKPLGDSGLSLILRRRVRKSGLLKTVTPHGLRHSFATALLDHGCDLRSLQEMLGHKNLTTTQVYTHTTLEKLRKIYGQSHPRADGHSSPPRGGE